MKIFLGAVVIFLFISTCYSEPCNWDTKCKYGFSTHPMDYPNMGLPLPYNELDALWDRIPYMTPQELAQYADGVMKAGINNERFIKDQLEAADFNIDFNEVNVGSVANAQYLLLNINPDWITNSQRAEWVGFLITMKQKIAEKNFARRV